MEPNKDDLLAAVQQLAISTLQLGKAVKELQGRLDRLEHVVTVGAPRDVLYAQRDIIA